MQRGRGAARRLVIASSQRLQFQLKPLSRAKVRKQAPCEPRGFPKFLIFKTDMAQLVPVLLLLAAILVSGCQKVDGAKIAKVDGQSILASDLQKYAGRELSLQRENLYKLEKQKLEEYISAFLLTREAKKRGVSVETVLDEEVNSKILPVGDDEIDVFYKSNKARIAVDLDKAREQIRGYLRNQKIEAQKALFFKSLRSKAKVVTYLKPPPVFRAELSLAGEPFKGSENARGYDRQVRGFSMSILQASSADF